MVRATFTIVGAGSIGLAAAARLAAAGLEVGVVTRRAEAAARIREGGGVLAEDVAAGAARRVTVLALDALGAGRDRLAAGPVLLCVRTPATAATADAIAAMAPSAPVVSVQNGVDNDAILAARFARTAGIVWRQTCTRVADDHVRFAGSGRVIIGSADADLAGALATAFAAAGFSVGRSDRLAEDRWLKLCLNLLSGVNAAVRPAEHATPGFARLKVSLLEEARSVLAAAGIVARSCDGEDPSLDAMIAKQRAAIDAPPARRTSPIYNSAWTALKAAEGPVESVLFHRRIAALGEAHGVGAPANARAAEALERITRERAGPESVGVDAFSV